LYWYEAQAKKVRRIIQAAEEKGQRILILSEVLIGTVWVLESVYRCSKEEVTLLIENLLTARAFFLPDATVLRNAIKGFKKRR
jgi:predicted nucleic-acid-binding protein